jgi:hypothetical protein
MAKVGFFAADYKQNGPKALRMQPARPACTYRLHTFIISAKSFFSNAMKEFLDL